MCFKEWSYLRPGKDFDFIPSFTHSSINISKIKKKDIISCIGFTSMCGTNYQKVQCPLGTYILVTDGERRKKGDKSKK